MIFSLTATLRPNRQENIEFRPRNIEFRSEENRPEEHKIICRKALDLQNSLFNIQDLSFLSQSSP